MANQISIVIENTDSTIKDYNAYNNITMPDDIENNILIDVNVSFFF